MNTQQNVTFSTYRYIRPLTVTHDAYHQTEALVAPGNFGGVTIRFDVDCNQDDAVVTAAYSVCSIDDNFNKSIARDIIARRFSEGDVITFRYPKNSESSLVNTMMSFLADGESSGDRLLTQNEKLLFTYVYNVIMYNAENFDVSYVDNKDIKFAEDDRIEVVK